MTRKRGEKDLRDDVEVGDERRLEDDGNVGRVEEFDGIAAVLATVAGRLDGQVDAEALRVSKQQTKASSGCGRDGPSAPFSR